MQETIDKALQEYYEIVKLADSTYARVQDQFPKEVKCHDGCIACCHSPFDLSLIEAIAVQTAFKKKIPYGGLRSAIATQASYAERVLIKEKKKYNRLHQEGHSQASILAEAAKLQVRCPLLGVEDSCLLYDDRPITCRIYGIPTAIQGKVHVCAESAFEVKKSYPTVHLSAFQDKLAKLSLQLQQELGSSYNELHRVYLPLSSVILHNIDKAWLGVK